MRPYVLIFAKTAYSKTPYDKWLEGSGVTPLILVAQEYVEGYLHLPHVFAFRNYDNNQKVQLKAIELVRSHHVKAVFARAESDIIRAAQLREIAKIPGQNSESALAYRNKVVMKNQLRSSQVALPSYQGLQSSYEVMQFIETHGYPVVIKPTTESGSFGTLILREDKDRDHFLENGSIQNMEIETFVNGQMYHVDGFVRDGKIQFIQPSQYINDCLSFRDDEYLGTVTVAPQDPVHQALVRTTQEVLAHLPSPPHFVFHCELWRCQDGSIVFCEIASRTGGAIISTMIEKTFGIDLDKEWLLAECNLPSTFSSVKYSAGGAVWIPPQKGTLRSLPQKKMPDWVIESVVNGRLGETYQGGVKSGLFLAAFVVRGSNENVITDRVHQVADWFQQNSSWDK